MIEHEKLQCRFAALPTVCKRSESLNLFQLLCIPVLIAAYRAMWKIDPRATAYAPVIILSSWICEGTSIAWYHFYQYPGFWWLRIGNVPALVPFIWPMVILTGREVIRRLWPNLGRREALAVGALVFLDASLIEVTAVQCGLWSWNVPGYLGVPLMGIVGWSVFAVLISLPLTDPGEKRKSPGWKGQYFFGLIIVPIAVHVWLIALWWGFFRWFMRGSWFWIYCLAIAAVTLVILKKRRTYRVPMKIALVRMLAASVFVVLLLFTSPFNLPVWLHMSMLAVPYALATDFR